MFQDYFLYFSLFSFFSLSVLWAMVAEGCLVWFGQLFIVVQVAMGGMDGRRDGGGGGGTPWCGGSCGWAHSCGLERCCMYHHTQAQVQ